jgi:predicted ester cyclase
VKLTGTMMGIAPTGKTIRVTNRGIFRIGDGNTRDNWVIFDALGMFPQIGAAPMPKM